MVGEARHTSGVLGFWTVFAQGFNGVREEEKSGLAHPSRGALFFARLDHLQATRILEQKLAAFAMVNVC
jgi:hypothetical protein